MMDETAADEQLLVCAVNGSVDALFDGSRTASEGRTDA